jgi:hypothetical protein
MVKVGKDVGFPEFFGVSYSRRILVRVGWSNEHGVSPRSSQVRSVPGIEHPSLSSGSLRLIGCRSTHSPILNENILEPERLSRQDGPKSPWSCHSRLGAKRAPSILGRGFTSPSDEVDPKLYIIIFGESLLDSAISIVTSE